MSIRTAAVLAATLGALATTTAAVAVAAHPTSNPHSLAICEPVGSPDPRLTTPVPAGFTRPASKCLH
jgi:hypothetical protein